MIEVKDVLKLFDKAGVNYCVLRNYDQMGKDGDIDLLVEKKGRVKQILENLGYRKGTEYGPYLSYKRDLYFDLKAGCMSYKGFFYKSAADLLAKKKKKSFFFILGEEDELIHLVLHSIIDKRYFKEEYKKRVEFLWKSVDKKYVLREFEEKFGGWGRELYNLISRKEYTLAVSLRETLIRELITLGGLKDFTAMGLVKFAGKTRKFLKSLTWAPYFVREKSMRKEDNRLHLDFNRIGVNKKFVFNIHPTDMGLSSQLKTFGFREPVAYRYHSLEIEPRDRVLDIGANLGIFAVLSGVAEKIVCVEPLKGLVPLLKKNIDENGLNEKTEIINSAVGNVKKEVLVEERPNINLSKIVEKRNRRTQKVKSVPLNDLVKKYRTNVLRMDLEGYEYEILYENIPKNVNKISLEFHGGLLGEEKSRKLFDYFRKEGFKIKYLIEDLPLRLYPFFDVLRATGTLRIFTKVMKDVSYQKAWKELNNGRSQRYLILERSS